MKNIYLLPFDVSTVKYSFDKKVLESDILNEKGLPSNKILDLEIEDELASKLMSPYIVEKTNPYHIEKSYYDKVRNFLQSPPQWFLESGKRIYVIFDIYQRCFWSPSGNNLNSIKKGNPDFYLSDAIRVELDEETYINLSAYFEWSCDNF